MNNAANAAGGYGVSGLGPVGNILGIYNGLQQGPRGMVTVGTNAAELYDAYTGASAAGSSAAGAGAAAGAGGMAAAAGGLGMGAMLAIAAHQPTTALSNNYWNTLNETLAAGPGNGSTYGFNGYQGGNTNLDAMKQYTDYEGAMAALESAAAGSHIGQNNQIPDSEWQTLAGYGITPESLAANDFSGMGPYLQALSSESGIPLYSTPSNQKM